MNTYLALFVVATTASLVLTPIVRRLSERFGWLDVPNDERRVHRKPVPRLGGVSVFASVVIALLTTLPFLDNLLTQSLRSYEPKVFLALAPAALIFLFGVYDDLRGASPRLKFIAQGLAAALFFAFGGRIEALSVPLVGSIELPAVVSFVLTVLWMVGITNAFNLIDGMDGLAGGAGLFASLVLFVVSLMFGHPLVTVVSLALSGALIGFLRYNFNPASIFLGDSGSLFIGFLLAALSVQGAQKASTAVAVAIPMITFGLPAIDTGFSLVRRFLSGRPFFEGDQEHIHHMLLARGWSQRRVAIMLYGVCAMFGMVALLFAHDAGRATGLVLFVVSAVVFIGFGHLRYHEVDEIKASMKRQVVERRIRTANNIRVRRASQAMSRATTLGEMFEAVAEMLESSEFVYAVVRLECHDGATNAASNEQLLNNERVLGREQMEKGTRLLHSAEVRGGAIFWSWERGDVEAAEVVGSNRFWELRLPLATRRNERGYINLYREFEGGALLLDTNYLCDLFQREMACAAERVLGGGARKHEERAASRPTVVSAALGR